MKGMKYFLFIFARKRLLSVKSGGSGGSGGRQHINPCAIRVSQKAKVVESRAKVVEGSAKVVEARPSSGSCLACVYCGCMDPRHRTSAIGKDNVPK